MHRLANGAPALSAEAKRSLTTAMAPFVPDGRLSALVAMGADEVATELSTTVRR